MGNSSTLFGRSIKNGIAGHNYHKWNLESRQNAAQHVKTDTRVQPRSEEPVELEPQVRLVCKVGGAYQFSAASLHSTVRILPMSCATASIFARYTWAMFWDGLERRNVDSECTGTTMGDYLRGIDLSRLPGNAVSMYHDGTEMMYSKV